MYVPPFSRYLNVGCLMAFWWVLDDSDNNNSIEATVADSCPGCQGYDVDLSPAAFKALAPLDAGRIWTNWEYIL